MSGRKKGPSQKTTLDPGTQRFVQGMRRTAQNASSEVQNAGPLFTGPLQQSPEQMAAPFFNPFVGEVVGGVGRQFDELRGKAVQRGNLGAISAGAHGSARHGISEGTRLGQLDRAQMDTVAGLLRGAHDTAMSRGLNFAEHQRSLQERRMQEPIFRQRERLNMLNMGLGPTGQATTTEQPRNLLGSTAGGAMTGFSAGGVPGAVIGGGLGLLGGLF